MGPTGAHQSCVNRDSLTTIRTLRKTGRISSIPGATEEFFDHLSKFSPGNKGTHPRVPGPLFPNWKVCRWDGGGLWNIPFTNPQHPSLNGTPSPLYTVLNMHCFPALRRRMMVQNLFRGAWKSFSMASPNSFPKSLPQRPPPLHTAWPVGTCLLPQEYHRQKRTTFFFLLWRHASPPMSTCGCGTTGTEHFASTAPVGTEHGPLWLNDAHLPRDMVEGRVEAPSDRGSLHGVPSRPSRYFGPAGSYLYPPHHRSKITTRWWLVDSSAPLLTRVLGTCGRKSNDNSRVEQSPTPLKKASSGALGGTLRWGRLYLVGTSQPRVPAPAPAPSPWERWHSTTIELTSTAKGRIAKVPVFGCHPKLLVPDPFGPSCRWWAHETGVPCNLFGLSPPGPYGQRSSHQALIVMPRPQKGGPATHV